MANKVRPQGLVPKGALRRMNVYVAASTIYPGDPVTSTSAGQVAAAAASTALLGAALSYATVGQNVLVADEPNQEFVIEADSADIASQTNLMLNYNIASGSPNTTYKRSGAQLDSSTGADGSSVSAAYPLKALAIEARDDNAFGANVDVVVTINNHQLKGGTGTVGT